MPNLDSLLQLSETTDVSISDELALQKLLCDLSKPYHRKVKEHRNDALVETQIDIPQPVPKKQKPKKKLSEIKERMFYSRAFVPKAGACRLHRLSFKMATQRKLKSIKRLTGLDDSEKLEQYFHSSKLSKGITGPCGDNKKKRRNPKLSGTYKTTPLIILHELSNSTTFLSILASLDSECDDYFLLSQTPTSSIDNERDLLLPYSPPSAVEAAIVIQSTWRGHYFRISVKPSILCSHQIKRIGRGYNKRKRLSKIYEKSANYLSRLSAACGAVLVLMTTTAPMQILRLARSVVGCSPSQFSKLLEVINTSLTVDSLYILREVLLSRRNGTLLSKLLFPPLEAGVCVKASAATLVLKALQVRPLSVEHKKYLFDIRVPNILSDSRPEIVSTSCEIITCCVCYETRRKALSIVPCLDKLLTSKKIRTHYPALKSVVSLAISLMIDSTYSKYLFKSPDFRSAVVSLALSDTSDSVLLSPKLLSLFAKWCSQDDTRRKELEAKVAVLENQLELLATKY